MQLNSNSKSNFRALCTHCNGSHRTDTCFTIPENRCSVCSGYHTTANHRDNFSGGGSRSSNFNSSASSRPAFIKQNESVTTKRPLNKGSFAVFNEEDDIEDLFPTLSKKPVSKAQTVVKESSWASIAAIPPTFIPIQEFGDKVFKLYTEIHGFHEKIASDAVDFLISKYPHERLDKASQNLHIEEPILSLAIIRASHAYEKRNGISGRVKVANCDDELDYESSDEEEW